MRLWVVPYVLSITNCWVCLTFTLHISVKPRIFVKCSRLWSFVRLYFVLVLVLRPPVLVLVLDDIVLATTLAYGGENSSLPTLAIIISVVISRRTMVSRLECTRVHFIQVSVSRPEDPGLGLKTASLVSTPVSTITVICSTFKRVLCHQWELMQPVLWSRDHGLETRVHFVQVSVSLSRPDGQGHAVTEMEPGLNLTMWSETVGHRTRPVW